MFLRTLWNSIKEIQDPFLFDGEHRIALHALQGNRDSSLCEGEVSRFFSSCGRNLGYNLEFCREWPFKTRVSSATSGLLSCCKGHVRILLKAWHRNSNASQVRQETQGPFPVATGILEFLSIFMRSQASSPFEALILCASRVVKGM